MTWIRLRQIALVAHDLDGVVAELHQHFGLEVAFNDPAVAMFGLRNAVIPVGTQFIEVVSPTREGTAGGRQLERLGGDGGYMVIGHTDDHATLRHRVDRLGVRVAFEVDDHGYRIMQLHPADTGGSFLELDFQPGGDDPHGPWHPAGPDWQRAVRTELVSGIREVTVQSTRPDWTSARWADITGIALRDRALHLENAVVHFVDGPVDTLTAVVLTGSAAYPTTRICGVDVTVVAE